jgi:diacylglycerol kinase (ATP)
MRVGIVGDAGLLAGRGLDVVPLYGGDAAATSALVADAVGSGIERIVVVGGDGLLHLVLQHTAQTEVVVGLVAGGTGNDTARALGLDDTVDQALGAPTPLDAIRVTFPDGRVRWIASVATLGFGGQVTERANGMRFGGAAKYSIATVLELPSLRTLPLRLDVDGVVVDAPAVILAAGNTSHFGGGMEICPGAVPTDGVLDVAALGDVGRIKLLRLFSKVFKGTHVGDPTVQTWRGRRVAIESSSACVLWGDGEPVGPLPVVLDAVPGALLLAGLA